MSVTVNDSIQSNSPKSLDNKYLNLGLNIYSSASSVNSTILSAYRSRGLTVNIGGAEYWYRDGIADVNLVAKNITTVVSPLVLDPTANVLSIIVANNTTSGYLTSADWITFDGKLSSVSTAQSVTNTGVVGNAITLVNDQSTPGNTMYYGTNGSGAKGYYPIPVSSGGGGTTWGSITGTLSAQTDLGFALAAKEPTIAAGLSTQYWRGDKTWQVLNTTAVPEGTNQYFTTARARTSVSAGTGISYNSGTGVITSTITQADGTETKLTAGTNVTITGTGSVGSPYTISTSGGGTVTSVGLTSTDFTISGSPVTSSGNIVANLATSGVTAGSYTHTALTVNSKGIITAATSGTLPAATTGALGLVQIGSNINVASGVISVTFPNPVATTGALGYVQIGAGINVASGVISVTGYTLPIASASVLGGFKVGSGLAIDGTGILSVTSGGTGTVTSVALSSTDFGISGSPITTAGTIIANLNPTGVASGTYNNVTVDTKGRVTAASNASYLTANQTITASGDVTGSGTTSLPLTLATVNSNVGSFNVVTVNAKGLVTAASNTAYLTANQTITLSGDVTGSGTTAITTTLANSGVTAGTYNGANVTVNAKGLITAIAAGGASGVTSVAMTVPSGLTVTGSPITSTGTLAITTALSGPVRGTGSGFTTGQTNLASEVTGNLPVTNLNSGTGATFLTFWRGNGTWGTPPNSGIFYETDSGSAITGTSAATLFNGESTGSTTIGANLLGYAQTLVAHGYCIISTAATPGTLSLKLLIGGTTTTLTFTPPASLSSVAMEIDARVYNINTLQGTTEPGPAIVNIKATIPGASSFLTLNSVNINTTTSISFDLQAQWSTGSINSITESVFTAFIQ